MRSIRPFKCCRLWLFGIVVVALVAASSAASQAKKEDASVTRWMNDLREIAVPIGNRPDPNGARTDRETQ